MHIMITIIHNKWPVAVIPFRLIITVILLELTPPDKAKVTNTSPDDSNPLKTDDVNCTVNSVVISLRTLNRCIAKWIVICDQASENRIRLSVHKIQLTFGLQLTITFKALKLFTGPVTFFDSSNCVAM